MFVFAFRIPAALLLRSALIAATAHLATACTNPESQTCASGIVCPIDSTCAANGEVCIYDDCGDGELQPGELCDDGNKTDGDGCSSDCKSIEVCGDGVVTEAIGEACDDGNTIDGDGCSADCRSREECGNGVIDPGEVCDDGNRASADGCRDDCRSNEECGNGVVDFHLDEKCDPGLTPDDCNNDCTSNLSCGNNFVDQDEECDDGNNGDNTDDCITTPGAACRAAYCGDGFIRENPADLADLEECDDAGESAECNTDCTTVKPIVTGSPDGCGDGIINATIGETCDDGARNGQHGYCSSHCNSPLVCGDGIRTLPEVCDTAAVSSVFDSLGHVVACRADCNGYEDYCGDGKVTGDEICDNGEGNNDSLYDGCQADCTLGSHCGDGYVDPSEQCDDPTGNSANPQWQQSIESAECSLTCRRGPYCGDGSLQKPHEVCEIGQTFHVATLSGTRIAACYDACEGYCGDGEHNQPHEGCDLGGIRFDQSGTPSGNGAETHAGVPDHAIASCRTDCTKCGDGERQGEDDTVDHGERCDEGEDNVAPLDYSDEKRSSCNTNCQINPYCGDGQHQADFEDCDAGNANVDADYTSIVTCNSNCQWTAHCGDNIIHDGRRNQEASAFEPGHGPDHGERCDAGGGNVDAVAYTNSQWQCNSNCQFNPFCGDGTRQENAGEACDRGAWPGGNVDGYHREWTCSTTCQVNPFCGDGSCTHGETSGNCSGDCPPPPNEE